MGVLFFPDYCIEHHDVDIESTNVYILLSGKEGEQG